MKKNYQILFLLLITLFASTNLSARRPTPAKINSNPSGATVTISDLDGKFTTPFVENFRKGQEYKITFKLKGYIPKTIKYTGGSGDINVKLQKGKFFVIDLPAGARVWIDGEKQNTKEGINKFLSKNKSGDYTHRVKIKFYGLVIKKMIQFRSNKKPYRLGLTLIGEKGDDIIIISDDEDDDDEDDYYKKKKKKKKKK